MIDGTRRGQGPARFGRYVLLDEIASGGMATVYLARLEGLEGFQRTVALKRPHPHLCRDAEAMTMFLDEARMAARIRHVNVVPTLDVVEEAGQVAIVMEYVEGEPLSNLAHYAASSDLAVPLGVAARIAFDVLEGLHAAHEVRGEQGELLNLVHRDVSPHNVLVGVDGLARVVDFGIAKAKNRAYHTSDSGVKGKLGYMAPEYLTHGQIDRRSDVYATAVLLWELVSGRRLFLGRNEHDMMTRVLTLVVPPLGDLRLDTPPALAALVECGLDRDPDRRYPDARSMAHAVRSAVALASNDEVGAWVKSLAGDSLAARAKALAAAERALAGAARAGSEPQRSALASTPGLASPGPRSDPAPAPDARGRSHTALFIAILATGAAALGVAWGRLGSPPTERSTATLSATPLRAPAPSAPTVAPVPPSADEASARPPAPPAPTVAPVASASTSAPPVGRPAPPAKGKPSRPACDPPYTYDEEGIRHFKPQSL
ncbi:MAG TPA: protein kinase [Polyangiaceae bacterium]|nr:protein kinase [Polyangiaceae bacterium]